MQHKTKKIWLIALLSLLIVALFAASFTYARYYKETGVTGGKYDDTIEFVGANKYIVYSPEELVSAIENGYSYIEIGEGAEEPFVITDGVTDVTANLVLDINGHDLVRNSRNPLIDVQKNVSVVIVYDSKSSGSFYNPVGSLLQASGGTLTIATGNFTSGPKEGDYVTDVGTTEEGVGYSLENYTVYYRNGYTPGADSPDRSGEYNDGVGASLPKIVPVEIDQETDTHYGNIYFETGISDNAYIKDDTFLIYTEETVETPEDATVNVDFSPLCDVASCDFYYYYEKSTEGSGEDKTTTYAVIYGYHDVMKGAEQQITAEGFNESEDAIIDPATAVIWPYAAVRMTEGEAFIRGGTYTNRFGTAQSYGIYARGGSLSVQGENTSFTSVADGVCIRCTTEDGSAPSLHIENGKFTSEIGDTVQVNSGTMTVNSGTFTKSGDSTDNSTKTAIIHMTGGALTAAGSADAGGKKSIQMTVGVAGSSLSNVFGVYSEGGTVELQNAQINVNGTYSAGVLAVTDGQTMSADKYAVTVADSAIEVNFNESALSSSGISTEGGNIQLEGSVSVSSQGLGITARKGSINIESGTASVETLRGTGVYVNNGTLTVNEKASLSVKSEMSENSWVNPPEVSGDVVTHYDGVVVEGGSLKAEGTLNVEFTGLSNDAFESGDTYLTQQIKSYAVRVLNAETVTISGGTITNYVGGGVYVGGGTVTLGTKDAENSNLKVSTQGSSADNGSHYVSGGDWQYDWTITGGHAVEVQGGSLTVNSGTYTAEMGNGILVRNLEGSDQSYTVTVNNGIFAGYNGSGRRVGPGAFYALKVMGGPLTLNVNGGTFGKDNTDNSRTNGSAFVMGDPVNKKRATVNVTGGNYYSYQSDCFSIFRYVDIAFKTENITMNAVRNNNSDVFAAVAVQDDLVYNNNEHGTRGSKIEIEGGTYTGVGYGLWYGASVDAVTVSGGAFTGTNEAGLYFGVAPNGSNVQLSGGTFTGNSAINANNPGQITTGNILANNAWCFSRVPTSDLDTDGAICTYEYNWDASLTYKYTQVGQGNSVRLNERGLWSFAVQGNRALNEYETVVIKIGAQISFDR